MTITRVVAVICVTCGACLAQPGPATRPASRPVQGYSTSLSVTEHEMKWGDGMLRYRATAGYLPVKDEQGQERANFFFVAYERLGERERAQRPVTFVFNGGPGAAAVWLHLGTAGPKRIQLKDDAGNFPAPPYKLVDNQGTWLDLTDLVFIDPVGTGYSRLGKAGKPEEFFGVREDISSVGEFIRLYTTKYERWPSPKFLAGESYGTTRAAGLSAYLLDRQGIAINGIALISTVLNFQTISPGDGNDLPYSLFLPSYAATAWHHKRLDDQAQGMELKDVLKEAEAFALGEYWTALGQGHDYPAEKRRAVATKYAQLTGLPVKFVEKANLRVGPGEFMQQLLEDKRLVMGRFDARITAFNARGISDSAEFDPSLSGYLAVYSGTFNDYVRRQLRYENDLQYEVLSSRIPNWNFADRGSGYTRMADELRRTMIKQPTMRVLIASGYYDLATPYFAADYTVNQMDLPKEIRRNFIQRYYGGGHMMYHNVKALEQLKADMRELIEGGGW